MTNNAPRCLNERMPSNKQAKDGKFLKDPSVEVLYQKAMRMRFNGKTYEEIAQAVSRKPNAIRKWFSINGSLHERYEVFKKEALELVPGLEIKSVMDTIKDAAPKAARKMAKLVNKKGVHPSLQIIAAKDILDRAGYAPVQKNANVHVVEEMSASELDRTFDLMFGKAKARLDQDKES